jgi:Trypsin-like peptidase domain/DnaJ domain
MAAPEPTLYEVLGVAPDARLPAIKAAYERIVAEYRKDTTPPDPKREALVKIAWETFLDPARRAGYDAALATRVAQRKTERVKTDTKRFIPFVAGAVVVVAVATWLVMRKPAAPPAPAAKAPQEIQADAARAIGRVQSIEMSGTATPLGLAFAVAGRMVATTCHGIVANAQILVTVEGRDLGARVSIADEELDVCKLAVNGPGMPPLLIATAEAKARDRIFVPAVSAAGAVTLLEGSVIGVATKGQHRFVEITLPAAAANGAPVLDEQSRVVGIVTTAIESVATRQLALPGAYVDQAQSRAKAP